MPKPAAKPLPPRRRVRPIPLAGLRGFESSARLLSFTLAAQELALTQSSVSRQIAALERQLGKPLFVRRTRALELTPAGEALYETARRTLAEIDRTVARVRGVEAVPRVTVATYASFASLWLVPRLPAFQRAHPGIDIRIDAADRMVDLEAEDIDLAIRWTRPGVVPEGAALLHEDCVNAALSPRLLASLPEPVVRPEQFDALPLLEPDESMPSARTGDWSFWCAHAGIAPFRSTGRLYFTYVDQSVQAAVRGQGAAIVRTPFLDDLVASGDLVVPFPNLRVRTGYRYYLLSNAQRVALPHVAAFRNWLIDSFRAGPERRT
ncbi:MAG: LysR substrate-binding domain-containing protein [Burkholderiales bacterium]|jgi:DNA-binding transcriptional LysR family regulator|nr:LysR substrate-binding domain-containing protein [Burkholderiales bacterium]